MLVGILFVLTGFRAVLAMWGDMALVLAGRALTTYSFLQTPVPQIFQNVNSVYGYVRMRVNATTLITEVWPFPVSMLACARFRH